VSIFWDETRIWHLETNQEIDGKWQERMSQRVNTLERELREITESHKNSPGLFAPQRILNTKGEPLVSSCSKDRIFELRLQALEQGKPVALADLVQEALEELREKGIDYTKVTTGPNSWDYRHVFAVGKGYYNAIVLLEYATSLMMGEEG
jgi:hypothetical protein